MEIVATGVNVGTANNEVKFNGLCSMLCVRCNTGTSAQFVVSGRTNQTIQIKSVDLYDILPITAESITVTVGAIDFIALAGDE